MKSGSEPVCCSRCSKNNKTTKIKLTYAPERKKHECTPCRRKKEKAKPEVFPQTERAAESSFIGDGSNVSITRRSKARENRHNLGMYRTFCRGCRDKLALANRERVCLFESPERLSPPPASSPSPLESPQIILEDRGEQQTSTHSNLLRCANRHHHSSSSNNDGSTFSWQVLTWRSEGEIHLEERLKNSIQLSSFAVPTTCQTSILTAAPDLTDRRRGEINHPGKGLAKNTRCPFVQPARYRVEHSIGRRALPHTDPKPIAKPAPHRPCLCLSSPLM